MRITCWGAAGHVTGSCYLLENDRPYLIDCGLFQGGRDMEALNRRAWRFRPQEIAALFLTHAHIDHSGRIPKLVRDGFRGKIYTTLPTAELCKILLLDAGNIQEMEAEWQSRKSRRSGGSAVAPLYTVADAQSCLPLFEVVEEGALMQLSPQLSFRFRNAGHILGASILEIWGGRPPRAQKVVFSGDLGRKEQLIVRDPQAIFDADVLFIESTYGNRNHRSLEESTEELAEAIRFSHQRREKVLIPAFAVERTQEILYVLGVLLRHGRIPSLPVYLDSPLAIAATEIFGRMREHYDEEAMAIVNEGHPLFDFPELEFCRTTQESMAINEKPGPAVVIAGNGMCTAGRIKHHLKHNLWRPGASLVIVGFQAQGSLGRKIIEGAKSVKIFGERIAVRARVFTIGGFSAHADQSELLEWLGHFENPRMRVYVVHGERQVSESFARIVHERLGFDTLVPALGEVVSLAPLAPPQVVEEPPMSAWKQRFEDVAGKFATLARMAESLPATIPRQLWESLRSQVLQTEPCLDEVLKAISLHSGSAEGGRAPKTRPKR